MKRNEINKIKIKFPRHIVFFCLLGIFLSHCGNAHREVSSSKNISREKIGSADTNANVMQGMTSWYGREFHGRKTASGERFNTHANTAAHKTLPFGTMVRLTNPKTGQSTIVRINDRGPFIHGRVFDVSFKAAKDLGLIAPGSAMLDYEILTSFNEILPQVQESKTNNAPKRKSAFSKR